MTPDDLNTLAEAAAQFIAERAPGVKFLVSITQGRDYAVVRDAPTRAADERRSKLLGQAELTAEDWREVRALDDFLMDRPGNQSREDHEAMRIIREAAARLDVKDAAQGVP